MSDIQNAAVPAKPRHWKFLGTFLWGALIFLIGTAASLFVLVAGTILSLQPGKHTNADFVQTMKSVAENGTFTCWNVMLMAVCITGTIFGAITFKDGATFKDYLALDKVPAKILFIWLGVEAVFDAGTDLLGYLCHRPIVPEFAATSYNTTHPIWLLWIAFCVAAPIWEELFFRGFMWKGFSNSFLRPAGAAIVLSALWASGHLQYDMFDITTIFVSGLVLTTARSKTGSIFVPMAMHMFSNVWATVEAAYLR